MKRPPPECESRAGRHTAGPVRLYPCGWRCPSHTPAAMAGRAESPPGPGWPAHRTPPEGSSTS